MKGNLVWDENCEKVTFTPNENGYWELVDGKIIQYHKSAVDDFVERKNSFDELNKFYDNKILPQPKQELNKDTQDYVITAFRRDTNIHELMGDGYYICKSPFSVFPYDAAIKNGYEIYSVKRLSDNETFALDEITEQGNIKEFYIAPCYQFSTYEFRNSNTIGARMHDNGFACQINHLTKKKEKQPLFTTDVINNKPSLSPMDIAELVKENWKYFFTQGDINEFIVKVQELAKQKLNK